MAGEQLSLWGREEPGFERGLAGLRRRQLDEQCWLDHAQGAVTGHHTLLRELEASTRWHHERRLMYEREVDVPRLIASIPDDGAGHPVLGAVRSALALRYQARFERIGMALYRDGQDSVAWHRDKLPRDRPTLVAILSLGAPRRFLVRRHGGGPSLPLSLGAGDLLVMGGMCQAFWEHCVPKVQHAEPRLSCMFRHVYEPG